MPDINSKEIELINSKEIELINSKEIELIGAALSIDGETISSIITQISFSEELEQLKKEKEMLKLDSGISGTLKDKRLARILCSDKKSEEEKLPKKLRNGW